MPRIAYFGPSGTFTEMALADLEQAGVFDEPVRRVAAPSQAATLEAVRGGDADGAVVPIESSIEGAINPTLDSLAVGSPLQIMAETELAVSFTIVAKPGVALDQVRILAAYPIAAAQVRGWTEATLPGVAIYPSASNSAAAQDVVDGQADAAVSTSLAAERLRLATLADGVIDYEGATTRFVLVTKPGPAPARTGADRTSVVLALPNEPGSLIRAFGEFSHRGIDLTLIESRPTRTGLGTYRFYLDCVGHIDDDAVGEALQALRRTVEVRFLGSWPAFSAAGTPPPSHAESAAWLSGLRTGQVVGREALRSPAAPDPAGNTGQVVGREALRSPAAPDPAGNTGQVVGREALRSPAAPDPAGNTGQVVGREALRSPAAPDPAGNTGQVVGREALRSPAAPDPAGNTGQVVGREALRSPAAPDPAGNTGVTP